jgi:hypothetical protein
MCVLCTILIWRRIAQPGTGQALLAFGPIARPLRHALIATLAVLLTLGTYFGVNYAGFRTFDAIPLQYYNFYHQIPDRVHRTGESKFISKTFQLD